MVTKVISKNQLIILETSQNTKRADSQKSAYNLGKHPKIQKEPDLQTRKSLSKSFKRIIYR